MATSTSAHVFGAIASSTAATAPFDRRSLASAFRDRVLRLVESARLRYPRTRKRPVAVLRALRDGPKRASSFHGKTLRGLRRCKHIAIVRNTGADPLIESTPAGLEALALCERKCGHVNGPDADFRPRQPCGRVAPFSDGDGNPRCGSHTPEALARAKAEWQARSDAYHAANPPRAA